MLETYEYDLWLVMSKSIAEKVHLKRRTLQKWSFRVFLSVFHPRKEPAAAFWPIMKVIHVVTHKCGSCLERLSAGIATMLNTFFQELCSMLYFKDVLPPNLRCLHVFTSFYLSKPIGWEDPFGGSTPRLWLARNPLKPLSSGLPGADRCLPTNRVQWVYPLVNSHITMERSTIFYGEIHYFYGHFQ